MLVASACCRNSMRYGSMKQSETDFGWRYKGRWVGVYRDLSRDGASENHSTRKIDMPNILGTSTCLQCGVCCALCHLAENNSIFPRQEMSLVQGGLSNRAAQLPTIWQCYQCDDCTDGCPSLAKPSEVMARLRSKATMDFALFPNFAKRINTKTGFAVCFGFALILMAVLGIPFLKNAWAGNEVQYRAMYPHYLLIPLFGGLTLLSMGLVSVGILKAWRTWTGATKNTRDIRVLWVSFVRAILEMARHTRFAACDANRYRRWAHMLIVVGFVGLCGVALFAALLPFLFLNSSDFLVPLSPFKIVANGFSWMMFGGIALFLYYRVSQFRKNVDVEFADWIFPLLLLAVVTSGLVSQWMRWVNMGVAAYLVYLFHLSSVFVLITILPFAKPAHALYRMVAEVYRIYSTRMTLKIMSDPFRAPEYAKHPRRVIENQKRTDSSNVPKLDTIYSMCHTTLTQLSDSVVVGFYNMLRDSFKTVNGEKRYFHIKNLYGTAFEREKDRRELALRQSTAPLSEFTKWYEAATKQSCTWWLKNNLLACHSVKSCMFCGMCTAVCPAAEYYLEYNPRSIVDAALSNDEEQLETLLKSDTIWYCGQCGSCKERCPRGNSIMGLVSSLRIVAQLKGFHLFSIRGRQQYASRYLWGSNFWNRGCSLYFRNGDKWAHPDFGPNYEQFFDYQEAEFLRLGANPDRPGMFGGRKINPETLAELRQLAEAGGTLCLWRKIDAFGNGNRAGLKMSEEAYIEMVAKEG